MGIFDIFTGDSAKEAAEKNRQLLQQNKAEGTATLQQGQDKAIGALGQSAGLYGNLAQKYGGATSLGLDALGVNGSAGNQRAVDAFHAGPGYQWQVDQALDAINRKGAATGTAATGNTLAALSDRAGNMANQEYGSWLNNLNSYVSPELQATGGQAGSYASMAPVYTNTANNIANLGTNTATGIAGQNTQEANAIMQGSGNLWGLGLNLAKLGVSAASGGMGGGLGSLLGGSGGTPMGMGGIGSA